MASAGARNAFPRRTDAREGGPSLRLPRKPVIVTGNEGADCTGEDSVGLSNAERQRAFRARRADKGLSPFTVYAPSDRKWEVEAFARALQECEVSGLVVRSKKTGRVATVTLDQF